MDDSLKRDFMPFSDLSGYALTNPYSFIPFRTFNLNVNGVPHFADPLEIDHETVDSQTNILKHLPLVSLGGYLKKECTDLLPTIKIIY